MSLSMTITRRETANDDGSIRMQVWVSAASEELPAEVFVYQELPNAPVGDDIEAQEQFVHVADFTDIIALGIVPGGGELPYYRKRMVDLTFTTSELRQSTWQGIQDHIQEMLRNVSGRLGFPHAELSIEEIS